jgi:hypothetical protein
MLDISFLKQHFMLQYASTDVADRLTSSMQLSPWVANNSSVIQEIPSI